MRALAIAAPMAGEIVITACDEFVENRIRVLPQKRARAASFPRAERRSGRGRACAAPFRLGGGEPSGLVRRDHGLLSWAISAFAAAAAFWSARDFFAWRKLK